MAKILVTGAAGFIGFHATLKLLLEGNEVFGVDSLNDYYNPKLKSQRLSILKEHKNFMFSQTNINDKKNLINVFKKITPEIVLHLAAQAGVRYSLEKPEEYISNNIDGFFNIIELSAATGVKHFIFASSSSVYGLNRKVPFSENDKTDFPISLYAATKKSNEVMAFAYSELFKIPVTGLRFFTVYGPYGRPDMAYYKFTKSILNNEEIEVYNNGNLERDFTFIDDIVNGIVSSIKKLPTPHKDNITQASPLYKIYNLGNSNPTKLIDFINILEKICNKKANLKFIGMQKADVLETFADIDGAQRDLGFFPKTSLEDGLKQFVEWYAGSKIK